MPAPLLALPLIVKGVCWCGTLFGIGYVCKKGHDAYKQGQKTKREKYSLKGKSLDEARKDNERINKENEEINKKLAESEERIKSFEKKISDAKKEMDDPNTSQQRKDELKNILAFLQTELDSERKSLKDLLDKKKKNDKDRENNNKTISGIGLNTDDKHWIWEFITLENILIVGACYMLYKMSKDDK